MPLINVRLSIPKPDNADALLEELSATLADQTGKPEAYVMTLLESDVPMTFAGSHEPCAFIEIRSIGALKPSAMSSAFCSLVNTKTGIPTNRIYVAFDDVNASHWGWNGSTFG